MVRNILIKVSCLFKKIDLFGVNLQFTYLNKEKHGTLFGSFCTFLLVSILLYKFINNVIKLVNKEDLDFKVQEFPEFNNIIPLNNFDFMICPIYPILTGLKKNYFNFTVYLESSTESNIIDTSSKTNM